MRWFTSIVLFAGCLAPLPAQDARGRVAGRVSDASGAIVPGVEVKAVNAETNVVFSGVSNEQGNYEIPYLPPGTYTLSAELKGFKKYVRQGIELRVGDRLSLDIALETGDVVESVTVSGETPLLEASTASIGQVVDNRRITDLPLSGGNPFTLAQLAAGVVNYAVPNHPNLAPAVEVVSNIGVSGTRDHNSEYSIDGGVTMWGRNAAFVPPADMVDQFKVQTASYDASLGHSPGGLVNVALRSGGNGLHGDLYEFHNDNTLQGIDFFQRRFLYDPSTGPVTDAKRKTVAPQNVMNRFGAVFSGPVLLPRVYNGRNRTFWIFGFEGLIRPGTERGNYNYTVPAAAARQGDFSGLLALGGAYRIYDPATIAPAPNGRFSRQPFAGNLIPASRLDPMAHKLLSYWPSPNTAGTADGRNNYFSPTRSQNEYTSDTVRIDHDFSSNHRLFGRYNQAHQMFASGRYFPNAATGNRRDRYNKGFGFDDVYVASPTVLLNVRYNFTRFIQSFVPNGEGFDLAGAGFSPALVSQLDPQGVTFPQIAVDQFALLGNTFPSGAFTNYHIWSGDLSKSRGNHSLRFGAEYRLYRGNNYNFSYQTPRVEFSSTWTRGPLDNSPVAPIGQGLASFLLGIPTGGRVQVNASYAEQSTYSAFYLQDDFRATSKLTLNLGLRYEYEGAPTERYNRSVRGFDFINPNPIEAEGRANYEKHPIAELPIDRFRVLGGLTFAGANGQPRALWTSDKTNFSPRIGLAYSLRRSTIVRAGYGIFYVPSGVDRVDVNQTGFTQPTNLVPSIDNGLSFAASLANPFPGGFLSAPGAAAGLLTNAGRAVSFFNGELVHGYMQRWSFGLQQELPRHVLMEAAYTGNRGTKLGVSRELDAMPAQYLSRSPLRDQPVIDLLSSQVANPFYPLLPGTPLAGKNVARSQLLRPYPQFTGMSMGEPQGFSWYHSLQVRAERRFAGGFTLQGNYTWSKFMESTAFLNDSDPVPSPVISDLDRPQRLVASGIWELPFGPGKHFGSSLRGVAGQIAGGWQFQGFFQAQSGAPFGFGNVPFLGGLHDIVLPRGQRTVDHWFNTEAGFVRDPAGQLASNIRTLSLRFTGLRTPGLNLWNLSAFKTFRAAERVRIQFRSEWLNATNHSHFAGPNTAVTNTLFGRITATNGFPRQIYFGLKLLF